MFQIGANIIFLALKVRKDLVHNKRIILFYVIKIVKRYQFYVPQKLQYSFLFHVK